MKDVRDQPTTYSNNGSHGCFPYIAPVNSDGQQLVLRITNVNKSRKMRHRMTLNSDVLQ